MSDSIQPPTAVLVRLQVELDKLRAQLLDRDRYESELRQEHDQLYRDFLAACAQVRQLQADAARMRGAVLGLAAWVEDHVSDSAWAIVAAAVAATLGLTVEELAKELRV